MGKGGRHGLNCPNSPYREYVRSWVTEICERYDDFQGIRFDMTFWPGVCYCDCCKKRFQDEVGGDIRRPLIGSIRTGLPSNAAARSGSSSLPPLPRQPSASFVRA